MANKSNCFEDLVLPKVLVEERGRKACFLNEKKARYLRARVDKCLVNNEVAADFVVGQDKVGYVVVELKGADVEHAMRQIIQTAKAHLKICVDNFCACGACKQGCRIAGLVVASEYPRHTTTIQRLRNEFAKLFKGPIHVVSKNSEFDLVKVLSFGGPR